MSRDSNTHTNTEPNPCTVAHSHPNTGTFANVHPTSARNPYATMSFGTNGFDYANTHLNLRIGGSWSNVGRVDYKYKYVCFKCITIRKTFMHHNCDTAVSNMGKCNNSQLVLERGNKCIS